MQNTAQLKFPKPQHARAATIDASPRKSDANWKPQACGLTREELRKIVEEILG